MNSAFVLFLAALIVMGLIYAKPNWFWNAPRMRRSREHLTQAQAEALGYGFCALIMVLALVAMFLGL
ncbi:MAG: hypothetical protein EA367_01845 [Leptolyngbya sp. DLM2.Bin15]|nr:MAG: hypothetical protein EA367_01845 [Leptolyngbya sp. DLM2.Bin15]